MKKMVADVSKIIKYVVGWLKLDDDGGEILGVFWDICSSQSSHFKSQNLYFGCHTPTK